MRTRSGVVVLVLSGCGSIDQHPDAAPPPPDMATGRCDPNKPFADVKPVAGVNTDQWDADPSLSPDELTMYFASIRQSPGSAKRQALALPSLRCQPILFE